MIDKAQPHKRCLARWPGRKLVLSITQLGAWYETSHGSGTRHQKNVTAQVHAAVLAEEV